MPARSASDVPAVGGFLIESPRRRIRCRRLFSWSSATAQRGVKAPFGSGGQGGVLVGSPAYDPALCAAAIEIVEPAAADRLVELNSQLNHLPMDNKPTFADRIAALKAAAETVMLEAQRMEAAQNRFAERKASRQTQRASR